MASSACALVATSGILGLRLQLRAKQGQVVGLQPCLASGLAAASWATHLVSLIKVKAGFLPWPVSLVPNNGPGIFLPRATGRASLLGMGPQPGQPLPHGKAHRAKEY